MELLATARTLLHHPAVRDMLSITLQLRHTRQALRADWSARYGHAPNWTQLIDTPSYRPAPETGAGAHVAERGLSRTVVSVAADLDTAITHGVGELLRLEHDRLRLLTDPDVRLLLERASAERAHALREAIRLTRTVDTLHHDHTASNALIRNAARQRRPLTAGEQLLLETVRHPAQTATDTREGQSCDRVEADEILELVQRIRIRRAKQQLDAGLLLDEQMRSLIRAATPAFLTGSPILLIGETGGAKTALAEYLCTHFELAGYEFVSGYGDITGAELIGTHELQVEDSATVTAFMPGPLLRAMESGTAIILDEINAMPPEILKRLNRILQLRPGDTLTVQEQPGLKITIAAGFTIIVTANEYSPHRYRGIEPLSSELVNRFGANTYRVHYPDTRNSLQDTPEGNLLLAAAAIAAPDGTLPHGLDLTRLEPLARAAFISQQVFIGNRSADLEEYRGTEATFDDQTGLTETVIAPRTLVQLLDSAMQQGGATALPGVLERYAAGIVHAQDRAVLSLIFKGQGLLP